MPAKADTDNTALHNKNIKTSNTYNDFILYCTDAAKKMTQLLKLDITSDVELYQVNQSAANCLTIASTNQR